MPSLQTSAENEPKKRRGRVLSMVAALAVLGGGLAVGGSLAYGSSDGAGDSDAVSKGAEALVQKDGFPAVLAAVEDRHGNVRDYTAGTGDMKTDADVPENGQVRAGSNTKSFTAAVVLQLVGDGKVKLDEPIETYLPGLIRGEGIDGKRITVRNLLQHTSGLPEYTQALGTNPFKIRDRYYNPRETLDLALSEKAAFEPGAKWQYSNTNYVVAGLLVEKVTGRPFGEVLTNRVIRPLGLKDTYWPKVGERGIRDTHPKGYGSTTPGGQLKDISRLDPSQAWAAGQLVTTPRDLNRFFSALLGGEVLNAAELKEMKTTVAADEGSPTPNTEYGLGLFRTPLSCGEDLWGHGGSIHGYESFSGVTDDGRAATVATTALSMAVAAEPEEMAKAHKHIQDLTETAICK
ncbi:serine hydrolase domain-containing protein [Streptomyces xiaopingdaonensis]|uniref:serine hydrolase domain-containing protein n=1 Tax=Streptomyces xiaopingdaonensis TaxID=1565415 RepID=UPI0003732EB2|nr:serine hydrolase domain-containing protein [Streptomyces xiaopingdaonensis]